MRLLFAASYAVHYRALWHRHVLYLAVARTESHQGADISNQLALFLDRLPRSLLGPAPAFVEKMCGVLEDEALYKLVMHLLRFPQTERVSEWVCLYSRRSSLLLNAGVYCENFICLGTEIRWVLLCRA